MAELTDYLAGLAEPARTMISALRDRALALVPDAEEGTSYGMPALRHRGRPLLSVMAIKAGYAVYPFSAEVVAQVIGRLDGFESTKGGIKFTDAKPLPTEVFDAIVRGRRDEIDAAIDRS